MEYVKKTLAQQAAEDIESVLSSDAYKSFMAQHEAMYEEDKDVELIKLDDLVDNPFNEGREIKEESIEAMMMSILDEGLQQPIIVTPLEDGKFRKVSGHIRTKAIERIFKKHKGFKFRGNTNYVYVPCIILKYKNDLYEHMAVLTGNVKNDDSKKERIRRAKDANKLYEDCIANGIKIKNKLDWLVKITGYSRKSICRYLNDESLDPNTGENVKDHVEDDSDVQDASGKKKEKTLRNPLKKFDKVIDLVEEIEESFEGIDEKKINAIKALIYELKDETKNSL